MLWLPISAEPAYPELACRIYGLTACRDGLVVSGKTMIRAYEIPVCIFWFRFRRRFSRHFNRPFVRPISHNEHCLKKQKRPGPF